MSEAMEMYFCFIKGRFVHSDDVVGQCQAHKEPELLHPIEGGTWQLAGEFMEWHSCRWLYGMALLPMPVINSVKTQHSLVLSIKKALSFFFLVLHHSSISHVSCSS